MPKRSSQPPPKKPTRQPPPQPQQLNETGQRVFECLSLGLVVFDPALQIIHHNPAAEFLVRDQTSVANALTAATIDAQYQDWHAALQAVITSGKEQRFEQIVYRNDYGQKLLLNLTVFALTEQAGNTITGGTLVIEDVTAVAGMEKRLAVSERMAAVGKLAARVAHELNNPLDGIMRYLNLASRAIDKELPDKVPDYLSQARGGLLRMTQIVRELVDFSRSVHTAFDDASINTIVEEAIKVMSDKAVDNHVSIVCKLTEQMPAIAGTNFFQVCCNLIKNAVDAMPDGGTLTVETRLEPRHAVIAFHDTGVGLPDDVDQIFEAFFTTKAPGKGTGLGLAVCKEIIDKYNGTIEPIRRTPAGTTFVIKIPLDSCLSRTIPNRPQKEPTA